MSEEKRTEYVGLYLTPSMAKQLREANDNETLKDKIIKDFITNETDWLKDEIGEMDEITTIYRAKLLVIKDNFAKAQEIYVKEIEKLLKVSCEAFSPLEKRISELGNKLKSVKEGSDQIAQTLSQVSAKIENLDIGRLEKLILLVDKFNFMSPAEKEIISLLLSK